MSRLIVSFDEIRARHRALERKHSFVDGRVSMRSEAIAKLEGRVSELSEKTLLLDKVQKVLMMLMDKMTVGDLSKMDAMVTYGLNTVFPDRDISMKSTMIDTGKKLYIDMRTIDAGKVAAKDQHGSASVIESFLLKVYCLLKTGGPRLLILDEPFGSVEAERIISVGNLLNEMASKLGVDILLVTHNGGSNEATLLRATLNDRRELIIKRSGGPAAPDTSLVPPPPVAHEDVAPRKIPVPRKKKAVEA